MNRSVDPKKVNSELFTLTYGALVVQLLNDLESVDDVNKHLDRMGYNIGVRLVEDFIARTGAEKCYDLRDTADKLQSAFRMYLGVTPSVGNWGPAGDEFSLTLDSNPLTEFVELPDTCSNMRYSAVLPGIVRGACEMVHLEVTCWFVQDQLRGDPATELRVKFVKRLEDSVPPGEE